MADDLFSYLNVSGPEYAYLGHFRAARFLEQGHNDLPLERSIEDGNIPDLGIHATNTPAAGMPSNNSSQQSVGGTGGGSNTPKPGGGLSKLFADQGGSWSSADE